MLRKVTACNNLWDEIKKNKWRFLKPIWAYGVQLGDTDSNSNIEMLQKF